MLILLNKTLVLCLLGLCLTACNESNNLSPFTSDGCSLFPDSSIITNDDWCECCFQHDLAYWRGGTAEERKQADLDLKQCVLEKTNDATLARVMYEGVRLGGSPYFYNWYRWGYGWSYERKYQALSEEESKRADALIKEYYSNKKSSYCSH